MRQIDDNSKAKENGIKNKLKLRSKWEIDLQ